jgi:Fe-Mn family superoxide dismutase
MTLHHSKHHQTYVTNLNASLSSQLQAQDKSDIRTQLGLQQAIKFNAGGHINHSLFWENLAPASSGMSDAETKAPAMSKAIQATYGGIEEFKSKFEKLLLSIQGSGWGWLVIDIDTKALEIIQTKDQDTVPPNKKPLFGVDMWEHAYYLQYLNGKPAYVKAVWEVANWKTVEDRFVQADWWNTWQPLLSKL